MSRVHEGSTKTPSVSMSERQAPWSSSDLEPWEIAMYMVAHLQDYLSADGKGTSPDSFCLAGALGRPGAQSHSNPLTPAREPGAAQNAGTVKLSSPNFLSVTILWIIPNILSSKDTKRRS